MSYMSQIVSKESAVASRSIRPVGGNIKRAFDILFALVAIVGLLPLFIGCCVLVFATSPGPVWFRHRRIGLGGEPFECLKFRTMEVDAERRLQEYLASDPDARREWQEKHKLTNDPRITPFGRFMRRTSLDELPQLINVLYGEMSVVGPRPIVHDEIEKYREHFSVYAAGRPGLTGLWQVSGRNRTTYSERVDYDVQYLRNWSLIRDVRIILATVAHVIDGGGAY
jgi:exopolysaccharide production protein ExoY